MPSFGAPVLSMRDTAPVSGYVSMQIEGAARFPVLDEIVGARLKDTLMVLVGVGALQRFC